MEADLEKTNAQRFIQAYNTIDQTLRYLYNYKRSMSFSDIVRRSVPVNYFVRKYEDKLVEKEKIMQILKAGMQAPSACNQQPWEFYVVTDKKKIEALSKMTPYTGCAAKAPVVLVSAYRLEGLVAPAFAQIDMSIAQENIWLETDALGLGGVWFGIAPNEENMEKVRVLLGLPEEVHVFALFALGYPAEHREQQDRFKPERIHFIDE